MVCALLRHIEHLWIYYCCYPKLSRLLSKLLINVWSESREEAAVIAFLILRKIYLSFNEHKKQETLKVCVHLMSYSSISPLATISLLYS